MNNRKKVVSCLLAGAILIGGTGIGTNAAQAGGVTSVIATGITSNGSPAAGFSKMLSQCLIESDRAVAEAAAQAEEQVSENDVPVVASEYADIAIAQVDNYVNVRSEPNTDSEVLGKLYNNSAATVLETTEDGWYRITSGSVDGYVKCEYVVPNDEELAKKVSTKYAKVNTTTLHVRTEPSTDASILTQVPVGDDLVVIDDESVEDWAKVTTEEGDGWVHKDYVDFSIEFVQAESKEEEKARLAKEEAERILSEAKAKADAILNDAQTQKAELLEQAKEEGRTRGYDEGKAKADAEEQEMQRHLQQLEESLNTDYRNKLQHMEQQVVEVVVHVFEKVFHIQFDDKTEFLLSLVSDAIMGIEGSKDFRIRVAEVNFEFMENHRHELEERVGEDISLEMIADPMLEENQCMIETDSGIFNCSLGVQLENLIKDLKSLSIN